MVTPWGGGLFTPHTRARNQPVVTPVQLIAIAGPVKLIINRNCWKDKNKSFETSIGFPAGELVGFVLLHFCRIVCFQLPRNDEVRAPQHFAGATFPDVLRFSFRLLLPLHG